MTWEHLMFQQRLLINLAAVMLCAGGMACGSNSSGDPSLAGAKGSWTGEIRGITRTEALADFDQMVSAFKSYYGPIERKEQRYQFRFTDLVRDYRARIAKS